MLSIFIVVLMFNIIVNFFTNLKLCLEYIYSVNVDYNFSYIENRSESMLDFI